MFLQRSAVLFSRAVAGVGVAAQAEGEGERNVVVHRLTEGSQRGQTEGDDLGDGDEVGSGLGVVIADGCRGGHPGEGNVTVGGDQEQRCQQRGDEVEQDLIWVSGIGHGAWFPGR